MVGTGHVFLLISRGDLHFFAWSLAWVGRCDGPDHLEEQTSHVGCDSGRHSCTLSIPFVPQRVKRAI